MDYWLSGYGDAVAHWSSNYSGSMLMKIWWLSETAKKLRRRG